MTATLDKKECQPMIFEQTPATEGDRMGGLPPVGVSPRFKRGRQKYFGTFGFSADKQLSIFYSLDPHGDDKDRDMLLHNNMILRESSPIHVVIHRNDIESPLDTTNPSFRYRTEAAAKDELPVASRSKRGGTPYADNEGLVGQAFEQLATLGFEQLLQLDTPNPRTFQSLKDYPWDPGWLHIFYKLNGDARPDFAFVVQQ